MSSHTNVTSSQQPVTTPSATPSAAAATGKDLDSPTGRRACKEFETMRARYALRGHALHRADRQDGPATFWAERWGVVQYLPTIDDARRFLDYIGGRL